MILTDEQKELLNDAFNKLWQFEESLIINPVPQGIAETLSQIKRRIAGIVQRANESS